MAAGSTRAPHLLGQTPSQTVGPFFAYGLTPEQYGYSWASVAGAAMADASTAGERIIVEGHVLDGKGEPIRDALIEIRQADSEGHMLRSAGANGGFTGFGRCGTGTDPDGLYRFQTIRPGSLGEGQAPRIDVIVSMRGMLLHTFTRLYFEDEAANADDTVLASVPAGRRGTLMARKTGAGVYRFDIRMQGDAETVFFDL
jgi:protocatechuate 3,4-dioxygenase, alpha subunit